MNRALERALTAYVSERAPVAALGLERPLVPHMHVARKMEELAPESMTALIWAGSLAHAPEAAHALWRYVRPGGVLVLVRKEPGGLLGSLLRGFAGDAEDGLETLCGALLSAGFAEPTRVIEQGHVLCASGVRRPFARG